ncbi:hypothetical protein [Streptomyces sp. NPDC002851]
MAFCHGTFGTAAWRWNLSSRTLSLSSLGRAQVLPAVCDFARNASLWAAHPHLADAFFTAYERPLNDAEQDVLDDAAVLASVEDLHHAITLHNSDDASSAAAVLRDALHRHSPTNGRGASS